MDDGRLNGPVINEPEIDPHSDTTPSLAVRPVELRGQKLAGWRRAAGLVSLFGAAAFTIATVLVLMTSSGTSVTPLPAATPFISELTQPPTLTLPTLSPTPGTGEQVEMLPTVSSETVAAILSAPLVDSSASSALRVSAPYSAFTTIPDRARSEVVQYTAVQGDTIYTIAQRFGIKPETIAWSNPRRLVQVLRPGDSVNILPIDGVYYTAIGGKSIAEIAGEYKLDDPYKIIDSEFNALKGATPEIVPPSGMKLVIPGGQAEEITWNPVVQREGGEGEAGGVSYITFAPGQAGSCGKVVNPGGGAYWANPLPNGTYVRGYSSWHTGIDLAAPVGTAVTAANGGRVIFAGWNSWGYGYTVVLAHGPFTTLYGHLSAINVGCGQDVAPGQVIAGVGSSGNSSGPHLHFEIRYNDIPYDPAATIGF